MLKLYNSTLSGNCYKVRLLLAHLGLEYETIEIDVLDRGSRPEELLRGNPAKRVPMLVFDDGLAVPESNAILWLLAQDTVYLPDDVIERTRVLQWMFFEQNLHEPNIAVVRYWVSLLKQPERFEHPIEVRRKGGHAALKTMEGHLEDHEFFVAGRYSIADISLYAYTHVADEGGFDLGAYPAIGRWMERVRAQPGHVPMQPAG